MIRSSAISLFVVLALVLTIGTLVGVAAPSHTAFVSNSNDAGPGSFRAAIDQANLDSGIARIKFLGRVSTIALQQTVTFTGAQDLTIEGNGAIIDGAAATGHAFLATGGGDLAVSQLTVRNAPGSGIAVDVPTFATGTVRVSLDHVDILNNRGHGVLVDDQDDPSTGILDGDSDASVDVRVDHCRFIHNGFSVSDRDGLRVNEGGNGDLLIAFRNSSSLDNGADGIEVDERGDGDIVVALFNSHVDGNGQFDTADLDDGFDIDESDDGSIIGVVSHTTANDNFEQGFDFNENHAGDLRVDFDHCTANGNLQEGLELEEDDDFAGGGDIVTTMQHVTANGNGAGGDAGLKIREKGAGNVDATLTHVTTWNNLIGGILIREDAVGNLTASVEHASSQFNAGHGIDFDENRASASDAGDLTAAVRNSAASNNTGAGVRADQQTPGVGTLLLSQVTLDNNTGGATTGSNVVITIQP